MTERCKLDKIVVISFPDIQVFTLRACDDRLTLVLASDTPIGRKLHISDREETLVIPGGCHVDILAFIDISWIRPVIRKLVINFLI